MLFAAAVAVVNGFLGIIWAKKSVTDIAIKCVLIVLALWAVFVVGVLNGYIIKAR